MVKINNEDYDDVNDVDECTLSSWTKNYNLQILE